MMCDPTDASHSVICISCDASQSLMGGMLESQYKMRHRSGDGNALFPRPKIIHAPRVAARGVDDVTISG